MRNDQRIGSIAMTRRAPDLEIFIHFTVAILLVHLLALFVIIGVSYRITQPLRQVTRSMDRIASGDLNERVDIKGRDEIAHMSNSFNSMADRVSSMVRGGREVLAGVSHELRSPLSRMKLSLEMLRESGAKSKHVGSIEEDIDELDGMVDELLTASRLDLGTETLRPEAIKLTELIDEGWHRVAVTPEGKSIDLERALEPEDLSVRVDRALGTRILGNLFENAARYGEGSPVAVKARELDDRVVISVADRGPGVTEDALDKLFIAFYRADSSRSRKTGGTGLGLMIVKRAVEAHGGSIAAANRQAEGLVITFDLPKV